MWAFRNSTSLDWTGRNARGCSLTRLSRTVVSWTRWHLVVHDWTGRDWAELLRIARLCTALDWTTLDCYWLIWTWPTLDWNVLGWKGINWNWMGADSTEWTGPRVSGVDRTGLSRTALQKTEMDGMHFTRLDCLTLSLTSPDCTTLHYPGLNWKVPYRTVTAPRYTDLHWTAFYVSKWNW